MHARNAGKSKEMVMKPKLRFLLALAIGVAILKWAAADASDRGSSIQMLRITGAGGTISRAATEG